MAPDETFTIEQKSSRGGSKLMLGILIGCGGVLVLCCGAFGVVSFMGWRFASQAVVQDPAEIRAATSQIADIELPAQFEPEVLLKLDIPIIGDMGKMVFYQTADGSGGVFLAEFSDQMTQGKSPEQVAREMQLQAQLNTQMDPDSVDQSSSEEIERTIRGEPAKFEIVQGKNQETGDEQIIVTGQFKGRQGVGFFMMAADPEQVTLEEVRQVVNSIE